jgi:hypothetical protein
MMLGRAPNNLWYHSADRLHTLGARQQQKTECKWTVIKVVNDRTPRSPISAPSAQAAASSRPAQICLAIILIVAAAPPAFSATKPQNQEQQGTGLSQAGTKSMLTSDPCASFRESVNSASEPSQTPVKVSISPQTDIRLAVGYSLRLADLPLQLQARPTQRLSGP